MTSVVKPHPKKARPHDVDRWSKFIKVALHRRHIRRFRSELGRAVAWATGLNFPSGVEDLREEQARALATTVYLFTALGVNTVALILMDFGHQIGTQGWMLAAGIVANYGFWVSQSLRPRVNDEHAAFMTSSLYVLWGQGILWGLLIAKLALVAEAEQRNFITGLMMALVSVPMMGAPFSAAIAFWLPTVIASTLIVASGVQPFETYMAMCFSGYVVFTLFGIVLINRTLLERSVGRVVLKQQNSTIGLLLRDYEENAADWLWEVDADMRFSGVTPRFAEVLGLDRDRIEGVRIEDLLGITVSLDPEVQRLGTALAGRQSFRDRAVKLNAGKRERWWSLTGRPVIDDHGRFVGYRGVGSDITDTKQSEEKVAYFATHDSLTDLDNRHMFLKRLDTACGNGEVLSDGSCRRRAFAVLLLDLDRFKEVNDDYGHASGDAVLVTVSERLREALREGDTVARLGGDEFAIMLVSGNPEDAVMVADRLIETLGERIKVGDSWLGVGASFGIAMFPRDGNNAKDLLRNVDLALYEAKAGGKATYRMFEPEFGERHRDRLALLLDLRIALETNQLHVCYQPIIDVQTEQVVSVEALARWTHPIHGAISPEVFIPLAEESGLIGKIGAFVLEEACCAASAWDKTITLSVNLSPLQFKDPALGDTIQRVLLKAGLVPDRLELEVTESAWLAVNRQTADQLSTIETLGARVVLDDFGTGFSSLSCLREFRFHGLKIDAGFMRDVGRDSKAAAIVKMIASLAREMGITLTAEGIERADQLELVRGCHIPRAQGYLFGRPMPLPEANAAFTDLGTQIEKFQLRLDRDDCIGQVPFALDA